MNNQTKDEKIQGYIDTVNQKIVKGWCFNANQKQKPVEASLFVNDQLIGVSDASYHRPGILSKGIHPTGNCEFRFFMNEYDALKQGDVISVKAGDIDKELTNSPWVFEKEDTKQVLIVGLAKSGTSILTYQVAEAIDKNCKIYFEPNGAKGLSDIDLHLKVSQTKQVVTKCLFPWHDKENKLKEISSLYDKNIWIIRDPRDNMISNFLYSWNKASGHPIEKFENALGKTKSKEESPNAMPFYELYSTLADPKRFVSSLYGAIQAQFKKLEDNFYILKYEDLMDGKTEGLNEYLGFEINRAVQVPEKLNRVVRSKKYGNWRSWFTEEDVKFFRPLLEPYLEYFQYNSNDWELENVESLPSEKGSEYMENLYVN